LSLEAVVDLALAALVLIVGVYRDGVCRDPPAIHGAALLRYCCRPRCCRYAYCGTMLRLLSIHLATIRSSRFYGTGARRESRHPDKIGAGTRGETGRRRSTSHRTFDRCTIGQCTSIQLRKSPIRGTFDLSLSQHTGLGRRSCLMTLRGTTSNDRVQPEFSMGQIGRRRVHPSTPYHLG
jgi:hypothetical protein